MIQAVLLVAALAVPQAEKLVIIKKGNSRRGEYRATIDKCAEAEKAVRTNPRRAIEILDEVIALGLNKVECRMRVEGKALEYYPKPSLPPADFKPYEFRGRAHLELSRALKGTQARDHLFRAIKDLDHSSRPVEQRGLANSRSKAPLRDARKAMAARLQEALRYSAWDPEDSTLGPHALRFLAAWPEEARATGAWLTREAGKVEALVRDLKTKSPEERSTKDPARQVVAWCDFLQAAGKGIAAMKEPLKGLRSVRAGAGWIVAYLGSYSLAVSVYPYARIEKIFVGGKELPLDRKLHTPLRLARKLEIADLRVVLFNPELKSTKELSIPGDALKQVGACVIHGSMEGDSPLAWKEVTLP